MARYIDEILLPGEKLLYSTTIHWFVYLPGFLLAIAALACLLITNGATSETGSFISLGLFIVLGLLALGSLAQGWWRRWTIEYDVTDRRIVYKRGFINRNTIEMNMDKVESVDVDQSLLGRLFNYGNVTVKGTGEGIEPVRMISHPIKFRSFITGR
jgi:uncharacterized membrane protein YdbT with pleckstrin-like domain